MDSRNGVLYEFDGFVLDTGEKCLWSGGKPISITPKAIDTLIVLVERSGSLVEKNYLLEKVWSDTFVEEATLVQNVSTLRRILGASRETPFIETVPRRGYRFVAPTRQLAVEPERTPAATVVSGQNGAQEEVTRPNGYSGIASEPDTGGSALSQRKGGGRRRLIYAGSVGLSVLVVSLVAVYWAGILPGPNHFESRFKSLRFVKLFKNSDVLRAVVSPDGDYVAIARRTGSNGWSLHLRQTSNEQALELTGSDESSLLGMAFSPDGKTIYYSASTLSELNQSPRAGDLYRIPILGGVPEKVLANISGGPALASDGRQIAFVRIDQTAKKSLIIAFDIAENKERVVAARPIETPFSGNGPSWSPDGKTLAVIALASTPEGQRVELRLVDVATGQDRNFVDKQFFWLGSPAWLSDGSAVIFPAYSGQTSDMTDQLWMGSFPAGDLKAVTGGLSGVYGVSVVNGDDEFLVVRSERISSVWTRPIDQIEFGESKLSDSMSEISTTPPTIEMMPDGRFVTSSTRNGNSDIWTMNPNGTKSVQLTADPSADYAATVSPDGRTIFFFSNRTGWNDIWKMNFDGTEPEKLGNARAFQGSLLSTDGQYVYFIERTPEGRRGRLSRMSVNGGEQQVVSDHSVMSPKVSPDGKYVACISPNATAGGKLSVTILSSENGEKVKQLDPIAPAHMGTLEWSPDSSELFFVLISGGDSELHRLNVLSGSVEKLFGTTNELIMELAVGRDGKRIYYEKGNFLLEVLLVKDVPEGK